MAQPPMISYAQNGEDVVLRRAFPETEAAGFYVDIGACHPVEDSVTLHFYERGWHGVNVEPDRDLHAALAQARPRDTNVCAAIGRTRGRAAFHPTGVRGHGTLDAALASGRTVGRPPERVPEMTLADVLDFYGPDDGDIDFLKLDVEGWEADALAAAEWSRHRPRVILVEAVDAAGQPMHEAWEPGLLAGGYRFALFDGLNRFYCREEDAERLLQRLATPANVLDEWLRVGEVHAREEAVRHAAERDAARSQAARAEERAHALGVELEEARAAVFDLARSREEVARSREETAAERQRTAQLAADLEKAQASLQTAVQELPPLRTALDAVEAHRQVLTVDITRTRAAAAAALNREEKAEQRLAVLEAEAFLASSKANDALTAVRTEAAAAAEAELDRLRVAQEAELDRLRAAQDTELDELRALRDAELDQLRTLHADLEGWLAAVRNSTSWRLTWPMRRLGRLVKGAGRAS